MDFLPILLGTIPSMLTIIGGVWYLSGKISEISAHGKANTREQIACNARHEKALEITNTCVDKLEYRVDKLGNRVTALETRGKN
ncbi:MAG: hypothetical protein P3T54_00260 [Dehalogenimonas sp.]|nr:hypothetical protein [Dehalogenimonas sp.]